MWSLIALTDWGDRWAAPDGPPILYRHATCGSPVSGEVTCATCGHLLDASQVAVQPGPGMPPERLEELERLRAGSHRKAPSARR